MENIIFYFSGTGNSLKVAKDIAKELGNGKIVSMAKPEKYDLSEEYDTIGFVYPTYYWGIPKKVFEFVSNLSFDNNSKKSYVYSITTYGGLVGNSISQLYELLLNKHNIKINYGQKLQMFSNYVVLYNMSKRIAEKTQKSNLEFIPVIKAIKSRQNNQIKKSRKISNWYYGIRIKSVSSMDKDYVVDDSCTGCGICKEVCPVKNIEIVDKKPQFKNNCEQCVACIQYCPQRAINYRNKTQKRRRYTNPEIDYKELSKANNE